MKQVTSVISKVDKKLVMDNFKSFKEVKAVKPLAKFVYDQDSRQYLPNVWAGSSTELMNYQIQELSYCLGKKKVVEGSILLDDFSCQNFELQFLYLACLIDYSEAFDIPISDQIKKFLANEKPYKSQSPYHNRIGRYLVRNKDVGLFKSYI